MTASGIGITGKSMREVLGGEKATIVVDVGLSLPRKGKTYRVSGDEHVPW